MDTLRNVLENINQWESKGIHQCRNGARLVCHLPKVAPKAYLHDVFPALNEKEIYHLENKVEQTFPTWLKNLYRIVNGLNIFSCTIALFGHRKNNERGFEGASCQPFNIVTPNTTERMPDAPPNAIFIGSYNWDGSLIFCYSDSHNPYIFRTERDSFNPVNKWLSFDEFIGNEYSRISLFFNSDGYEKNESSPTTPN